MPYNVPIEITYYGFPIIYRLEDRNGHPTLILSYRQNGKIVYEHPPRRIRNASIEDLPQKLLEEFFRHLLTPEPPAEQRERGLFLRRSLVNLPLAVLLAADSYTLFYNPDLGRKKVSIEDDERAIMLLLQQEGQTPWREVTPARSSRWMYGQNLSDHMRISIKRVMRSLFLRQAEEGIIEEIPWCNYDPNAASRPKQNFKSLIRANVDPTTLTDGQCQALLTHIDNAGQKGNVSGIDIALLLRLTLALPLEEICALNIGDFHYLSDYPNRLTVNITHYIARADDQSSYRIRPHTDPYKIRKLPLSAYFRIAFESYKRNRKTKSVPLSELPLVPAKNNIQRRMRPEDLRKELEKRFDLLPHQEIIISKSKHPSLHKLLSKTAPRELLKSGFEDEELRFLLGQPPKLVSAKSYADYLNEAELNKLGALQDRWLGHLWPERFKVNANKIGKLTGKNSVLRYTSIQSEHTQVVIQIAVPKVDADVMDTLSDEGILLELGACYGCSGVITFSPIEQGDTNDAKQ